MQLVGETSGTGTTVPALEITGLTKVYPGNFHALKGISLKIAAGDFFALLGPNGAGKSTTIGIVASLVHKTAGTVRVFGHDLDRAPERVKACMGLVPQEFNFNIFEEVENILIQQAGYYGIPYPEARRRAEKYLKKLELWDKRCQPGRNLSGGMKRRLMIARAMIHEPQLLILDEPTAGVDIEIRHSMWEFIREINAQGTTIILTTHYLEEVEANCRNVAIINHGEILTNTPLRQLLASLDEQTFVLDLAAPLAELPDLPGARFRVLDPQSLEVTMAQTLRLNALFAALTVAGIEVASLRVKGNRLETLFLNYVQQDKLDG